MMMPTEDDVHRRAAFGTRWADLLTEAAVCGHFYVHNAAQADDGGKESLARMLRAAWDLAELERAKTPEIIDHFGRLVARLSHGLAAVRTAALAFAGRPGDPTRTALLDTIRDRFRAPTYLIEIDASPFADDAEARAWAHHRLAAY